MAYIQNNLRFYRKQKGLSQWDVARALGFKSNDRISKWESGLMYPHVKNLIKLGQLLEVKIEDIYKVTADQNI